MLSFSGIRDEVVPRRLRVDCAYFGKGHGDLNLAEMGLVRLIFLGATAFKAGLCIFLK